MKDLLVDRAYMEAPMASTMNHELAVTTYKTIDALDQVYADIEWLEREVEKDDVVLGIPVDDSAVDEDALVLVTYLSLLHERGAELLELLRSHAAVEDDGRLDAE
jgi:hypothetical protein